MCESICREIMLHGKKLGTLFCNKLYRERCSYSQKKMLEIGVYLHFVTRERKKKYFIGAHQCFRSLLKTFTVCKNPWNNLSFALKTMLLFFSQQNRGSVFFARFFSWVKMSMARPVVYYSLVRVILFYFTIFAGFFFIYPLEKRSVYPTSLNSESYFTCFKHRSSVVNQRPLATTLVLHVWFVPIHPIKAAYKTRAAECWWQ